MAHTPTPLRTRKLDTLWCTWFAVHLVIMFTIDLVPLYPTHMQPGILLHFRRWIVDTYHDRQFTHPTGWFLAYTWMELVYHVPLSIWAVRALIRDDPVAPVHLLVWAVSTAATTFTCMADYYTWPGLLLAQRQGLDSIYGPYLLLSLVMTGDMVYRLHTRIRREEEKTKRS